MYLRILAIIAVFNWSLAASLTPSLLALSLLGFALAGLHNWCAGRPAAQTSVRVEPSNPLELSAAALFAVLFVVISIASTWAADHFGAAGLYVIAAIVGATDIDPFVLSIAQGGASSLTGADAAVAVLTATASNNLLKAAYTVGFTGHRRGLPVVGTLVLLSGVAVLIGFVLTRH
jgi:Predicted membrane protein